MYDVQVPAAAAEAGAVCRPGWPGAGALLQADPAYLQPVHYTVRHMGQASLCGFQQDAFAVADADGCLLRHSLLMSRIRPCWVVAAAAPYVAKVESEMEG